MLSCLQKKLSVTGGERFSPACGPLEPELFWLICEPVPFEEKEHCSQMAEAQQQA